MMRGFDPDRIHVPGPHERPDTRVVRVARFARAFGVINGAIARYGSARRAGDNALRGMELARMTAGEKQEGADMLGLRSFLSVTLSSNTATGS